MHLSRYTRFCLRALLLTLAFLVPVPASGEAPGVVAGPAVGLGQVPDTIPATLRGVVFDSTRARVLSGARVAVIGTSVSGVTDGEGTFELTGIPPGEYSVSFHHPRVQELGVSPGVRMVRLGPGQDTRIRLSIPSRTTILRGWCALKDDAAGLAHVGGTVTDSLTGVPLPNARVELGAAGTTVGESGFFQMRTDDEGRYRFCGIPPTGWMSVRVRFGTQASEPVAIRPDAGDGIVQDFSLELSHEVRITGRVLDQETQEPLEGAHVQVAGTGIEGMTGAEGSFGFGGLPPGRHVLVTRNLGYEDRTDTLTVFSREALGVEIYLSTDPIALEPLVVVGRSRTREPTAPRWTGGSRRDVMTREEIEEVLHRTTDAAELLRLSNIPGLNVRRVTYKDSGFSQAGLCVELARARRLAPETCAMVSVYLDGVHLSSPEYALPQLDPRTIERLQILSPLEAGAAYGVDGRNGVLLIFTR